MPETVVNPGASEDENLIINLDVEPSGEGGDAATARVPSPPAAAAPVPSPPASGLEDLQKQIERERSDREAIQAENRRLQEERDRALAFAQEAEKRGISTHELHIETQLKAASDQIDALVGQQEAAYNDGNFKVVAEINKKLNRLGGQIALLEEKKEWVAAQARVSPRQAAEAHAPVSSDPVELAGRGRTEPTKSFLRRHPEIIRADGTLKRVALDAHEKALDEGYAVDSDGYFRHIEKVLAENGTAAPAAQEAAVVSRQGAPTVAAPVARSAAPGSVRGEQFVMTPKMRRLAEEQGVAPAEWAREYTRLLKEGRVTPIT